MNNDNISTVRYKQNYDAILYFEYDSKENSFYDECGMHVDNMLEVLTPNDLYLFRHNPLEHSYFTHREHSGIVCKIILNGVDKNEEYHDYNPCEFSNGSKCQFHINKEADREAICRYCRG